MSHCRLPQPKNTCRPCGDITSRVRPRNTARFITSIKFSIDTKLYSLRRKYRIKFSDCDFSTVANECCANINLPNETIPMDIPSAHRVISEVIVVVKDAISLNYIDHPNSMSRNVVHLNETLCRLHRLSNQTPSRRITFTNCLRTSYLQTCRCTRDCKLKITMALLSTASKLMQALQDSTCNGFWGTK